MNVIWIFGDQHRAGALGSMGDPNVQTPVLDRLSTEGVHFTRAVMGTPLCCPCRGSLLSGRYPHCAVPGHEHRLPPELPTVGSLLSEGGVDTAWFGKWHVDGFHESEGRAAFHHVPRERRGGFRTWVGYENNNAQFDCWAHGHDGEEEVPLHPLNGYETDALTDKLIEWLGRRSGDESPFFAALSVQPPHDPYIAPEAWMRRHTAADIELSPAVPDIPEVRDRLLMIENLDWNVLRPAGTGTAILFFSARGHARKSRWLKLNPHEDSIRVPMIFWMSESPIRIRRPFPNGTTGQPCGHADHVGPVRGGGAGRAPRDRFQFGVDGTGAAR